MSNPARKPAAAPRSELGPFSAPGAVAVPWDETEWALRRAQKFQLCTVRPDGRPHVTPLLAIWADGAMWFTTGEGEQKARNLRRNDRCVLTSSTGTLNGVDHVLEGTATLVTDPGTREDVATAFEQAYGWQLTAEDGTWYQLGEAIRSGDVQLHRIRPSKAFAFATGPRSAQTRYLWTS